MQGHGFVYLGTNHWLLVGMAGAESEAGEQDAGGTRVTGMEDRVGLQSGHMLYHPHSDSPASGLCSAG